MEVDTTVSLSEIAAKRWGFSQAALSYRLFVERIEDSITNYILSRASAFRRFAERPSLLPWVRELLPGLYVELIALECRQAATKDDPRAIRDLIRTVQKSEVLTDVDRDRVLLKSYVLMRREVKAAKIIDRMILRPELASSDFALAVDAAANIGSPVHVHNALGRWIQNHGDQMNQSRVARRLLQSLPSLIDLVSNQHHLDWSGAERYWFPDRVVAKIAADYTPCTDYKRGLVMHVTSALGPGGAERQFVTTMTALQAASLEQSVAGERKPPPVALISNLSSRADGRFFLPPLLKAGVTVHEASRADDPASLKYLVSNYPEAVAAIRTMMLLPPRMYARALNLYYVLRVQKPEIVHFWQDETNILGAIAALLAGVPRIFFFTRSRRPLKFTRRRRYIRACYQELLKLPNVGLVNNSMDGARDYEKWLGLAENSIATVYNAVDYVNFRKENSSAARDAVKAQLSLPKDARVFGGVMRTSAEKQPLLWLSVGLRLAERHPNLHCVCVGDGPYSAEMKAVAAASPYASRFHFPGSQSPVAPWMGCMDVLVSTSFTEGLPNVPIEAQCLGVPVVATDAGGSRETIVDGVSGFICGMYDEDGLVQSCERAIFDEAWRETAERVARENCEAKFSVESMVKRLAAVYGAEKLSPP
jgi:glycosyltransferase involved in cell wall biosynthesis